jgi:hypothetical protein
MLKISEHLWTSSKALHIVTSVESPKNLARCMLSRRLILAAAIGQSIGEWVSYIGCWGYIMWKATIAGKV